MRSLWSWYKHLKSFSFLHLSLEKCIKLLTSVSWKSRIPQQQGETNYMEDYSCAGLLWRMGQMGVSLQTKKQAVTPLLEQQSVALQITFVTCWIYFLLHNFSTVGTSVTLLCPQTELITHVNGSHVHTWVLASVPQGWGLFPLYLQRLL